MNRRLCLVLAALILILLLPGCGKQQPVAQVNGEKMTQDEFDRYVAQSRSYAEQMGVSFEGEAGKEMLAQIEQDAINRWVEEKLVLQAAEEKDIITKDEEVDKFVDERIKASFENEEKYREWLKTQNITEDELKYMVRYQLTGEKLYNQVTGAIKITDEQALAIYEKDKSQWEKVEVSHILIKAERDAASEEDLKNAEEKAKGIIKQLDSGADFAELAKENSEDPGSAVQGGVIDMEFSRTGSGLVPEFVEGSFQLKQVGDYSKEPVRSDFGYHIIKLDAKKGTFEEVKEDVKNQAVQEEKNRAFENFIEDFKKNSKVITNLPAVADGDK